MRLSIGNVIRSDHDSGGRYSEKPQPFACQMTRSRRDHAPAVRGNRVDEFGSTGHHGHAIVIIRLAAFELPHLSFRIEVRGDRANNFYGSNAVADCHHFVSINSLLARPNAPLPFYGTGGVDKNTVEIKENGRAAENSHSFF